MGKEIKIKNKTCTEIRPRSIIVFPSFVWHRVLVTRGTRYSLVIWKTSGYLFSNVYNIEINSEKSMAIKTNNKRRLNTDWHFSTPVYSIQKSNKWLIISN